MRDSVVVTFSEKVFMFVAPFHLFHLLNCTYYSQTESYVVISVVLKPYWFLFRFSSFKCVLFKYPDNIFLCEKTKRSGKGRKWWNKVFQSSYRFVFKFPTVLDWKFQNNLISEWFIIEIFEWVRVLH